MSAEHLRRLAIIVAVLVIVYGAMKMVGLVPAD